MSDMSPIPLSRAAADASPPAAFDARALTGPRGLARLILDDKQYFLRITRAGKLILTK